MEIYVKNSGKLNDTNTVCDVTINGIKLPIDVQISISGGKKISQSQILDGVVVFERVTRQPYEIDFDFVLRDIKQELDYKKATFNRWIFPINALKESIISIWNPDEVVSVENEILEGIGIKQIVISDIQVSTIRGSINVPVKIKAYEDYYSIGQKGTTLLLI